MKNTSLYYAGYALLGILLFFGAFLVWNTRITIRTHVVQAEKAAKPAEIELTLITPVDCDLCVDGNRLVEEIQKQDVRLLNSKTLTQDSEEGTTLINTFQLERLPAILVKGEYDKPNVRDVFLSFGGKQQDDTLVLEVNQPVYLDLASKKSAGIIDITYLTDSSCPDCYDPTNHKQILENNFGVTIQFEQTIDAGSPEGRRLIDQYNITQTPTILLSPQALAYDRLTQTWQEVGSIEEDGTFIFRQNAALGAAIYKDLEKGEVIRPQQSDE